MPRSDFILRVFCPVDDLVAQLASPKLRARGFAPTLADSAVIPIELIGEFLGPGHDKGLFAHVRRPDAAEVPDLRRVHRTTFARQAAHLAARKQRLHAPPAAHRARGRPLWLVDRLPVEACRFGRAKFCRRLRGAAAFGDDHSRRATFYGSRLHARATTTGAVVASDLAPADVSDRAMVPDLDPPAGSVGIGDRNDHAPQVPAALAARGVRLRAPFRPKARDPDPARSRRRSRARWIIETAFGPLAERFHIQRTWARDRWHRAHRVIRKALSHTAAVWIDVTNHRPAVDFDGLAA